MTRSNRTLNRVILIVLGILGLAAAAALLAPALALPQLTPYLPSAETIDAALVSPIVLWSVAAAALVVAVLSLTWIATRGHGRARSALETDHVTVDARVVSDLLRERLAGNPDVLGVSATPYRLRGALILGIRVVCRRRAAVPTLVADTRRAVDEMDDTLGAALPALVHVTTGTRGRFQAATATH